MRRNVRQRLDERERAWTPPAGLEAIRRLLRQIVPAHRRAEIHADTVLDRLEIGDRQPCVLERVERSRHAKLRGARHPPRFFRVDVLAWVVINDFARDLDFQTRWIERLDAANARLAALEPLPKFREASQRRYRAHS